MVELEPAPDLVVLPAFVLGRQRFEFRAWGVGLFFRCRALVKGLSFQGLTPRADASSSTGFALHAWHAGQELGFGFSFSQCAGCRM